MFSESLNRDHRGHQLWAKPTGRTISWMIRIFVAGSTVLIKRDGSILRKCQGRHPQRPLRECGAVWRHYKVCGHRQTHNQGARHADAVHHEDHSRCDARAQVPYLRIGGSIWLSLYLLADVGFPRVSTTCWDFFLSIRRSGSRGSILHMLVESTFLGSLRMMRFPGILRAIRIGCCTTTRRRTLQTLLR